MTNTPSAIRRYIGIVLLSLPLIGLLAAVVVTIHGITSPPPGDVAGLSKAGGIVLWVFFGWITLICAAVGSQMGLQAPMSIRASLFFVLPPLALGFGVLLWDTALYQVAIFLIGAYFVLSLASLIVCPLAISSAIKNHPKQTTANGEAEPPSVK